MIKYYTADILKWGETLIDIHSHLLYDIDDGPHDMRTSLDMCAMALDYGIDAVVSTSHLLKPEKLETFIQKRDRRIESLNRELAREHMQLHIHPGAEVYVNDDVFYSRGLDNVTLNNSRYLLIEFDFDSLSPERMMRYIEHIYKIGCVPIVAHPERYRYLQRDYTIVNYLCDSDVLFQINAGSLAAMGSREEFELAYRMVLNNVASFIATDSHSPSGRANDLLRMVRHFPQDISSESLDYMLYVSPQAVLRDKRLPFIQRRKIQKRRFF